ncbi:MAG TPA: FG-GAP-like repeat-containing protein [Bryobacteraceae bacterium]|nr:FG-GAP-like repeat-containing protein [Bryobacteraceae bacterium]
MFSRLSLGILCASFNFLFAASAPSTTTLQSSTNPSVFGRSVTLTAKVSPATATGKVTFYDGVGPIGVASLSNGTATFTTRLLPFGLRSLKAFYAGDAQDQSSTSTAISQTVITLQQNGFQPFVNVSGANLFDARLIAVGDVNGDGFTDLVASDFQNAQVSVLFGNGDGTFKPGASYAVGQAPVAIVVADFDGDGHSDVAVCSGGNVSVLLNTGNGTFRPAVNYRTVTNPGGMGPNGLQVTDFNLDGVADLITSDLDGTVSVLLGKGDGTFQTPITTMVSTQNFPSIAVLDVNGDGLPDLVAVVPSGVAVFLGKGDGHFQSPVNYPVGPKPGFIVAGDLNGDGRPDLAISTGGNTLNVLLANANGAFQPAIVDNAPGGFGVSLTIGDFNGDGHADLAAPTSGGNSILIFLGNGDGTFRAPVTYSTGPNSEPQMAIIADFNGDGISDLATADFLQPNSTVLLGTPIPEPFVTATAKLVSPASGTVSVGDSLVFELDIANAGNLAATNLALNDSNPTGGLSLGSLSAGQGNCAPAASSLDCTGLADLGPNLQRAYMVPATATAAGVVTNDAMFRYGTPPQAVVVPPLSIIVQPAAGEPTFTALSMPWRSGFAPNAAIVKSDGVVATDLPLPFDPTIPGGVFSVSSQDASAASLRLPTSIFPASILLANLAGNGLNDIVVLDSTQSTALVVLNVTAGSAPSFSSVVALTGFASAGLTPNSSAAFQDPATGFNDLAIIDAPSDPSQLGEIVVAVNDGTGNLGNFVYYGASGAAGNLIGMDFNNDGLQDLAFLDPASNSIGVMLDSASGFGQPVSTSLGSTTASAMAAGDFNGDGFTDLAVLTPGGVNIFYGAGDGTFNAGPTLAIADPGPITGLQPGLIAVADFNGDGNLDIAVASPASNVVAIFSGDGQGNFGAPAPYVARNPIALAAGTLAGASNASLAVINGATGATPGKVSILKNM